MTENCLHCEKPAIGKHANGNWYCNECLLEIYRNNEINMIFVKKAEEMTRKGIKRGSVRWIKENIQLIKDITGHRPIVNWRTDLRNSGIWVMFKNLFVCYFLID